MNFYLNWHRNCERSMFEQSNLLNKKCMFNFDLSRFFLPVEVEVCKVPHFKASFNAKVEPLWLKHAGTVLKTDYLVHKTVLV